MRAFALLYLALLLAYNATSPVALAQTSTTTTIPAQPTPTSQEAPPQVDYQGAVWVPAAQGNFQPANRPEDQPIEMVIVHDIEGPDTAALGIFQRVGAKVSSHYVVGADGTVYQMVREHDIAWHAGNGDINRRSIGIETHGYAYRPGFFSSTIYETEAKLVRSITQRYNIPRDRAHIIGHAEVPNPRDPTRFGGVSGHTDPGPYWNWDTFMALMRNDARVQSAQIPPTIRPGEKVPVSVTLQNTGDDVWVANKASNPREGLQANAPVIFLGTSQGAPSALSNLNGWMSPLYADVLKTTDVAPGGSARFDFTLQGPRTLGLIDESLRAMRIPTMAQGGVPTPFGDPIPLKLNVVPWDIVVSTPDALLTPNISPNSLPIPSQLQVARWTVKLPIGGTWNVFFSPPKPAKARKKDSFVYRLSGADQEQNIVVAAKDAGSGFVFGGSYRVLDSAQSAPTITVTLVNAPEGVPDGSAGSLRFVGPFPISPEKAPTIEQSRGPVALTSP